jgi:hypothetical protein
VSPGDFFDSFNGFLAGSVVDAVVVSVFTTSGAGVTCLTGITVSYLTGAEGVLTSIYFVLASAKLKAYDVDDFAKSFFFLTS